MLNDKSRELILVLQKDPLANFNQLAEALGSTPPTIKRRMEQLQHGDNPVVIGIHGSLNHQRVGLELDTYFINLRPGISNSKFNKLFDLFDVHPYTSYQNRCFGAVNGLLVQLYRPVNSKIGYRELIESLENLNIEDISYIPQVDFGVESFPIIQYWKEGKWDFSFFKWFEEYDDQNISDRKDQITQPFDLNDLELPHLVLLRELSNDGRRKQVDIMNQIQRSNEYSPEEKGFFTKDKQREVSRYNEFINQNYLISNYHLLYNRESFGIFNQVCFVGRMDKSDLQKIYNMLQSVTNTLPFRSRLGIAEDRFFWWLNLPPHQSMEAMNFVFELSSELDTIMLDSSVNNSRTYPLWHRNFDNELKQWKQDHEWVIKNPLNSVL